MSKRVNTVQRQPMQPIKAWALIWRDTGRIEVPTTSEGSGLPIYASRKRAASERFLNERIVRVEVREVVDV